MPGVYGYLEAERIKYAIRLPANQVLQNRIGYLLKRPVGRPPNEVRRYYANFTYQAGSWTKPRRVIAKVEWHPGELYPRIGFIVTNMSRPAEWVVAFYNKRGTAEQWIKEGKGAIKWTRLSCRTFAANAVRLQLHALAYNLGNFLRPGDFAADCRVAAKAAACAGMSISMVMRSRAPIGRTAPKCRGTRQFGPKDAAPGPVGTRPAANWPGSCRKPPKIATAAHENETCARRHKRRRPRRSRPSQDTIKDRVGLSSRATFS
jgi:Transposase DDE domain group 1